MCCLSFEPSIGLNGNTFKLTFLTSHRVRSSKAKAIHVIAVKVSVALVPKIPATRPVVEVKKGWVGVVELKQLFYKGGKQLKKKSAKLLAQ